MTPRNHLPDERPALTKKVEIGGKKVYITTGEFDDGSLGEIFIRLDREGGALRGKLIKVMNRYGSRQINAAELEAALWRMLDEGK